MKNHFAISPQGETTSYSNHEYKHYNRDFLTSRNRTEYDYRIELQTNDYLCLAQDKRIIDTKIKHLKNYGHGNAVSRIFTHDIGADDLNHFETRFAKRVKAEDAVLTMSGYNANTGLIQAFACPQTPVYIDQYAHASLWEGILCARAKARPFRHNNIEDLHKKIRKYGPGLVVIDALYSTTGTIAPLADIVHIAKEGDCTIVVDETHSFGCQGPDGAGLVVEKGLEKLVDFRTIGLSKAVAARGGVVVGSKNNMEFFRYEARPMIFSTSVLGYEVAGFNKVLDIMAEEPWRRFKVKYNHATLKQGLLELGYNVSASDAQIIGIVIGDNEATTPFKEFFEKNEISASPFSPPATPAGKSMMRMTINASLEQEDIDQILNVCERALKELDTTDWVCLQR